MTDNSVAIKTFRYIFKRRISCKNLSLSIFILSLLSSCLSIQKSDTIEDGNYRLRNKADFGNDSVFALKKTQSIYLEDYQDSIYIFPGKGVHLKPIVYKAPLRQPLYLSQGSIDIDLFIVPVKMRLPQAEFPAQLNTQFNACMYLGYRKDLLQVKSESKYLVSPRRLILANGFGFGGFVGLAAVVMNPWVTQNQISYEYDGLAVSYGISAIYAVQKFNAGFALGTDYLTDRNRGVWIYQHQPWIGVLVGLNIN